MFYIDKTTHKIILTKGDSAEIQVGIQDAFGNDRGVFADDVLTLTIRKSVNAPVSLAITAINGIFSLAPEHTKSLPVGKYVYDVELKSFTGGTYTIIPKSTFLLEEEITR